MEPAREEPDYHRSEEREERIPPCGSPLQHASFPKAARESVDGPRSPEEEKLPRNVSKDTMPELSSFFSESFAEADSRFMALAKEVGAEVQSIPISAKGPSGEELFIRIARIGPETPTDDAIVHISGTHGIEGFTGSAIQLAALTEVSEKALEKTTYFIHGLNPYGMSHYRRVNESNVDLNRNCIRNPSERDVPTEMYAKINHLLNTESAPPRFSLFYLRAALTILRHGFTPLKQAVAEGQYDFPKGVYYGGKEKEEGIQHLEDFFAKTVSRHKQVVAIDIHTGLGKYGDDILMTGDNPAPELAGISKKYLGKELYTVDPNEGVAYSANGELASNIPPLTPDTQVHWVLQEFGTYHEVRVISALIDENRHHHHGNSDVDHWSKRKLYNTFNPPDKSWREQVVTRGLEVYRGALEYLNNDN